MKSDINLKQLTKGFSGFVHRYHVLIFTLTVVGGLSVATFLLYHVVSTTQATETPQNPTQFDNTTMKKIDALRSPNDPAPPLQKPSGRTNPFQE